MGSSRLDYLNRKFYPLRWVYRLHDYAIDDALAHLAQYDDERVPGFGNPYIADDKKMKVISVIKDWIKEPSKSAWEADLKGFEQKALDKWYGPQGATPSHEEVMSVVPCYYANVGTDFQFPELSDVDKLVLSKICKGGSYDLLSPRALWNKYSGSRKSNSGLTGWTDRRNPVIRKRAIMEACSQPNYVDPIVVGSRDQRSKKPCRLIFMDSFANYYREVQAFNFFERELKDSDAVAWRGDRYVERYVNNFVKASDMVTYFEGDYEMMDTWLEAKHLKWVRDQLKNFCNISLALEHYQDSLTDSLFSAPLWTPEGEIRKVHALFSGLYPTNPFETPLNLVIYIMWINHVVAPHLGRVLIYEKDYIIIVLGDDSLVIFRNIDFSDDELQFLRDSFASYAWTHFHVKAHPLKQRTSRSSGFFCKRQYKKDGFQYSPFPGSTETFPKSIYSLVLACMSIFEPEDGALDSKAQSLLKLFQVFDNAQGHPLWKQVLRKVWEVTPDLHIPVSADDIDRFNSVTNKNWRLIIFGEKFSLENSASAKIWLSWSK